MNNRQLFNDFSGPDGQPTLLEKRLIEAAQVGRVARLRHRESDSDENNTKVSGRLIASLIQNDFYHPSWPEWNLGNRGLIIYGAEVSEIIDLSNSTINRSIKLLKSKIKKSIRFSNSSITGDFDFSGSSIDGGIDLQNSKFFGKLSGNYSTINHRNRIAINGENLEVLAISFKATTVSGLVSLTRSRIFGSIDLSPRRGKQSYFKNADETAIDMTYMVASDVSISGARIAGQIILNFCQINGPFAAFPQGTYQTKIIGSKRGAFTAISCKFSGPFFLNNCYVEGETCLLGSEFFAIANLSDSKFVGHGHRAISIDGTIFHSDLAVKYSSIFGQFRGQRFRISGSLDLSESKFFSSKASTLQKIYNKEAREAIQREQDNGINASISINFSGSAVGSELIMPSQCPVGMINFSNFKCLILRDLKKGWINHDVNRKINIIDYFIEKSDGQRSLKHYISSNDWHIVLDGFTYERFANPSGDVSNDFGSGRARVKWLLGQSPLALANRLNPQPWKHCAAALRNGGYPEDAHEIIIEYRRMERKNKNISRTNYMTNYILDKFAGYGYRPWDTVKYSIYFILIMFIIYSCGNYMCPDGELIECDGKSAFLQVLYSDFEPNKNIYPEFHALLYSIDQFFPFLNLGMDQYWRPNEKAWVEIPASIFHVLTQDGKYLVKVPIGWLLYLSSVLQTIIGSIMVALAISGFTGILTRDDK